MRAIFINKMNYPFESIQEYLKNNDIDAFYIPSHDRFFSEMVNPHDEVLKYFTGFSGTFGFALITQNKVFLWVDGRYTLQAKQEVLCSSIEVFLYPEISLSDILKQENITSLMFESEKISLKQYEKWQSDHADIALKTTEAEFMSSLWKGRAAQKFGDIFEYPIEFSGIPAEEKMNALQAQISAPLLITQPDELCWLFNIRGHDVAYTPLVYAYALVFPHGKNALFLFDPEKAAKLSDDFLKIVDIKHYKEINHHISGLENILCDFRTTPSSFLLENRGTCFSHFQSPIEIMKAQKNVAEMQGMKNAHIKDAIALTETLCWLDLHDKKEELTELDVVAYLYEKRSMQKNFKGDSFPTIAGCGSNGAIIHYRPSQKTNRKLLPSEFLLLIDSGGQYLEGTTDVTRTVTLCNQLPETIKRQYTNVLKGSIALSKSIFKRGTSGKQLDVLARQYLWENGEDYAHGTGHGVGCFLNVHEGPQGISPRNDYPLSEGMVVSNEPGYYKNGAYGIRLENLEIIQQHNDENFLCFKPLTLVPYDEQAIDFTLLEKAEKQWLLNYYQTIKKYIYPLLSSKAQHWFLKKYDTLLDECS